MNIARTRESLKQVDIEEDEIMESAEKQYKKAKKENTGRWNGRQIRNAFQERKRRNEKMLFFVTS